MNDPGTVRIQYETEDRLQERRSVWQPGPDGRSPQDVAAEHVIPRRHGAAALQRHFADVRRTDVATRAVFEDHAAATGYLRTFDATLAEALPRFEESREYAGATTVFTAR